MNTKLKREIISSFISRKHKGLKVTLKAIMSGAVLMSNRKGDVVQVNKSLIVISSDRYNVILSDGAGHTLKLPISSDRIASFNSV